MIKPLIALISGLVGGLLVALLPEKFKKLRNPLVFIFTLISAVYGWMTALPIFAGESFSYSGQLGGLPFIIAPDPLSAVFGLIVSSLWVFAAVYSFGYMQNRERQKTFFVFFMFSLSVTMGVAYAGNLLALYLFYELLTLMTYPLVVFEKGEEAKKAGNKYILYSLSGAAMILMGIILTYARFENLHGFAGMKSILEVSSKPGLEIILMLFIAGFGVKAAIMPLHRWLPSAMVAPTPVSALLHAVAVVFSGVYGIIRVLYSIFGPGLIDALTIGRILPWIASISLITGVSLALKQDVLKKRLAYETISQLSYITLGAFAFTPEGLAGSIIHLMTFSVLKMTLFFTAGIIATATGKTRVSEMAGVGKQMPWTMAAFTAAAVGMLGMLPLNLFWSKHYLIKGNIIGGRWPFAVVLLAGGIINSFCLIPVSVKAFQREEVGQNIEKGYQINLMLIPVLLLIVVAVFIGLYPGFIKTAVDSVIGLFFPGKGWT